MCQYTINPRQVTSLLLAIVLWPRGGSGKSLGASRSWCFWVEQTLQNHNQLGVLATPLCFSLNSRWRMAAMLDIEVF